MVPRSLKGATQRLKWSTRIILYALMIIVPTTITLFFTLSYLNSITPVGIIIHHSAVAPPVDGAPVDWVTIDRIHKRRGYEIFYWGKLYNIGYHYVILPDGTVQEGRPELLQGSHTKGYNSYIGICLIGNFNSIDNALGNRGLSAPTEAQIDALIDLSRRLQQRYGFPRERILRHSDVGANTQCPGDRFPFQRLLDSLNEAPRSQILSGRLSTFNNYLRHDAGDLRVITHP